MASDEKLDGVFIFLDFEALCRSGEIRNRLEQTFSVTKKFLDARTLYGDHCSVSCHLSQVERLARSVLV